MEILDHYCKEETINELQIGIYEIEELPTTETTWIPVEERLPEINAQRVLVCAKRGNQKILRVGYNLNGCWEIASLEGTGERKMIGTITHWQPLPQPPNP